MTVLVMTLLIEIGGTYYAIKKDSNQVVKLWMEGVIIWKDTQSCAETARPPPHVRWRRNVNLIKLERQKLIT